MQPCRCGMPSKCSWTQQEHLQGHHLASFNCTKGSTWGIGLHEPLPRTIVLWRGKPGLPDTKLNKAARVPKVTVGDLRVLMTTSSSGSDDEEQHKVSKACILFTIGSCACLRLHTCVWFYLQLLPFSTRPFVPWCSCVKPFVPKKWSGLGEIMTDDRT